MLYDALMREPTGSPRGRSTAGPVVPGLQARDILAARGRIVLKARRRVLRSADAEAIHVLRVATRRLQAALDLFERHLPERPRRRLERRARAIRRRFGALRNACVVQDLLARIATRLTSDEKKYAAGLKRRLDRTIAEGRRAGRREGLPGLRKRLRRVLRALGGGAAARRGSPVLAVALPATDGLVGACREAHVGDVEAMHRLRLAIKRHRYALEILSEAGHEGLQRTIREARALQGDLGGLHDLDLLIDLVHGEAYRPGASPLLRRLLRRRTRQAEGVMRRLMRYLPVGQSGASDRRTPDRAAKRPAGSRSAGTQRAAGSRPARTPRRAGPHPATGPEPGSLSGPVAAA